MKITVDGENCLDKNEINKWHDDMNVEKINWNKLRQDFFHECVSSMMTLGHFQSYVRMTPDKLFEWFKDKIDKYLTNDNTTA